MEDRADTRSPHELFETAVQEIALEGRHGCNWDRVWEMIKLDDKSMRNVIEKMLQKSNRVVIVEDDETDEILIASAWERVRALGISQPYVVLDETELRILEIVGKHRENGCSWVNTAALLKKYQEPKYFKNEMNALPQQAILLPDAWSQNVLKKKDNAQYGDQLAMERMVHAKIIEKELVSSYQKGGSRITVNTLRLARYCTDEISTSTQQQITGGMDAWKRALRFRLMYVMNDYAQSKKDAAEKKKNDDEKNDNQDKKSPPSIVSGIQSSYLILSQPENVIATLPFADVLKKIKDENWMKKIEYLMGINGPETSLQKAAHMMEICKKVTAKDDTIILFSTKVIPLKQSDENDETKKRRKSRATTNGNERDLWCVGIKKTVYPLDFIDLIPGRLDRRGKEDSLMFATSTNIPQYSVHPGGSSLLPTKLPIYHYGALRTIFENIRASGTKAGRARVLSESLQQDTNKIVEKCITHLVRSGYVQLRRITEGRMHSYLAFENHAFRVYNLCDDALALAESEKVLQKSKNEETMRQRPIFIIDDPSFPEPFDKQIHSGGENSNQMPHQLDTTAQTNQLKKYTVIAIDGNQDISLPKTNNENTKKRSDRRDMSYILGKTIHKHATAERQRRAAHVIATLTKLKAVEKGNLQIALYRRSNSERSKSKYRVDHKTWKRLLDQLVSTGELNQGTYPVENDENITIISAPTATEQDIQKYINDRQRRKKEQIQAVKTAAENRKKAEEEKKKKIDEKNFKKKKRRKKVQSILQPPPPPPPLPKDQEHLYQHNKHQLAPPRPRRKTRKDPKKKKIIVPRESWRQHFREITVNYRQNLSDTLGVDIKKMLEEEEAKRKRMNASVSTATVPVPRKKICTTTQSSSAPKSFNNLNTRACVLKRIAPREKVSLVVAGVAVIPVARHLAKYIVGAHLHSTSGIDINTLARHATDSYGKPTPRATADAACSRLLRTGWAKHSSDLSSIPEPNNRCLEFSLDALIDSARAELLASFGDPNFFKSLDDALAAMDNLIEQAPSDERRLSLQANKIQAAHIAVLFQAIAFGTEFILQPNDKHNDGEAFTLIRPGNSRKRNAISQSLVLSKKARLSSINNSILYMRKWRQALGDSLNQVPWITPHGIVHQKLKGWLIRLIFAAVLTSGITTCHAITESRRRSTPSLDDLETAAILLDLCEAECIIIDREPPSISPPKLTIFGPIQGNNQSPRNLALNALTNDRGSDVVPRFSPAPDALRKFLDFDLVTNPTTVSSLFAAAAPSLS